MQNFIINKSWIIFAAVFCVAFIFGIMGGSGAPSTEAVSIRQFQEISYNDFTSIFFNNVLLAISLLLGFLTFNIYNLVALMYNGVLFGAYFSKYAATLGISKTLLIVAPHGIFEVLWFVLISAFSVQLTAGFYKLLNSNLEDRSFFSLLISKRTWLLLLLAAATVLIEVFVTPELYNYITKT